MIFKFIKDAFINIEYYDRQIFKLMARRESKIKELAVYERNGNCPDPIMLLKMHVKINEINLRIGQLLKDAVDAELWYSSSDKFLCKLMLDAAFFENRILIPSKINDLF